MSSPAPPHSAMKLTTLRKRTAPLLPPPILRLIHTIDRYAYLHRVSIKDSTGATLDEPSMTLLSSIIIAYSLWRFFKGILLLFSGKRSTAHLEENVLSTLGVKSESSEHHVRYNDTVIICGAVGSGKTALLQRLLFSNTHGKWELPMTVTSIVANAAYLTASSSSGKRGVVRIIDYPGHPSLASQFTSLLVPSDVSRLVFTIDTTQPVTEAVTMLYSSILVNPTVRSNWTNQQLDILVTCTKTDCKGSKNYKRIKIQIRNELERLRKIDSAVGGSYNENGEWILKGKNIDLDNLGKEVPMKLYFAEVGLGSDDNCGVQVIRDFVLNGTVPVLGNK